MAHQKALTRRSFLARSAAALGVLSPVAGAAVGTARGLQSSQDEGRLVGTVPLSVPPVTPLNRLLGSGLDARLFTDLSTLDPATLVVPNDKFFIRTACPDAARSRRAWSVRVDGLVREAHSIDVSTVQSTARTMGTFLLECSGNGDPNNFGLISAARWGGMPAASMFERAGRLPRANRVLISGVDHAASQMRTSLPGASWIFGVQDLIDAGAFFATDMNGERLSADHGGPLRLVVPGWYGCTCIKWVDAIAFVDDTAASTAHMREFADRTHQRGVPALARDYLPATIDHAAMPIRLEKWMKGGRVVYRVVGIQWGGETPIDALLIRFRNDRPFVRVQDCPRPDSTLSWSLWTHEWSPESRGRYDIVLKAADPSVRTRRLDMMFYRRTTTIDEI